MIFGNNLANLKARFKSNRVFLNERKQFIKQLKEKKKTILLKDNEQLIRNFNSSEVENNPKSFFKKDSVKLSNKWEDITHIKILLKKLAYQKKNAKIFGWLKRIREWILDKN